MRNPPPYGWQNFPDPKSPQAKIVKTATEQFDIWSGKLKELLKEFDERDAIPYWNILSAIYTLTEFDGEHVRATTAHELSGLGVKSGQRKFAELKKAGLIITSENPANNKEKFAKVSAEVGQAITETLDEWADEYLNVTRDYRNQRKKQGKIFRYPD